MVFAQRSTMPIYYTMQLIVVAFGQQTQIVGIVIWRNRKLKERRIDVSPGSGHKIGRYRHAGYLPFTKV